MQSSALERRQFLVGSLSVAAALMMPAAATAAAFAAPKRSLAFDNLHTGEHLTATYWNGSHYAPAACGQIDWLLRDFRTGEVEPISTRLLDLLYALRGRLGTDAPFEVISGYRSPKTNAALAKANKGVAKHSLHMKGMAIDVRVPGCALKRLHAEAVALRRGGVGYYPRSNFVHVDVGRVRYW